MTKMTKTKPTRFTIGTRVCHKTDKNLNEGVIIWVYKYEKGVIPEYDGKIYLVFWSNHKRGVYKINEIEKNNFKAFNYNILKEGDDI